MQINEYFGSINDPRIEQGKLHPLSRIFGLTIASISGVKGWEHISAFGKYRYKELDTVLDFSNGVPSHDTLERVYSVIDPQRFLDCFLSSWTKIMHKSKWLVAVDGKVACGYYDTYQKKAHIYLINAWANKNKLVLGQYQRRLLLKLLNKKQII